jgi:hypothetical protein
MAPRISQRPRRRVSTTTLKLATPLFRYSASREAYVLRGVGGRFGPVLRSK